MTLNQANFAAIVETAKAKAAGNRRWIAAIEKAAAGVVSGWWVITELADCVAVTTECGNTYFAGAHGCQCEAFQRGQACKHRGLYRLLALYNESDTLATKGATSAPPDRVPRVTRSVERDPRSGARVNATYCDGWAI